MKRDAPGIIGGLDYSWNYYINDIIKQYSETMAFIAEQKALPFEQTQKQVLQKEKEGE